jgi:hypothetical protein
MSIQVPFRWIVVCAACWSVTFPLAGYSAGNPVAPVPPVRVYDLVLDADGVLRGAVTSASGQPRAGAEVVAWQAGQIVAATATQDDGQFAIRHLRPGVYEFNTARSATRFRVWAARTAPPGARRAALLVEDPLIVRGQQWNAWQRALILSGVIITSGVVGGVIGYNVKDDAS